MSVGTRRRIVHVVYSFGAGGLENVIVQLINRLPADRFEHVVLSLTTIGDFKQRIAQAGVRFIELRKPPGHALRLYPRIYRLLRELRPDVIHTCNLAALEITPIAWLARVPLRVHAEHGWDVHDLDGKSQRYRRIRKLYKPFVNHFVAVSRDIDEYLAQAIGIPASRRSLIANGVDIEVFAPRVDVPAVAPGCPFVPGKHWVIGTVGRLQTVKNQPLLAQAFAQLRQSDAALTQRMRLVIVGEGPLRDEVERILASSDLMADAWLPGERHDVESILRMLDVFVLPSQTEGTSCTLQEALATGLPAIATDVGGTSQLIENGATGVLIKSDDVDGLAQALRNYFLDPLLAAKHGRAAREVAVKQFSVDNMTQQYSAVFLAQQNPHS